MARSRVSSTALLAAAARACGTLHTLVVLNCLPPQRNEGPERDGVEELPGCVTVDAVEAVLAANARTMRVVRAYYGQSLCDSEYPVTAGLRPPQLFRMLRAAPLLDALHADVACVPFQAAELVAGHGTAAALRIRRLVLCRVAFYDHGVSPELLGSLSTHPSLCELVLDSGLHLSDLDEDNNDNQVFEDCVEALASCANVTAIGLAVGFQTSVAATLVELLSELFPSPPGPLRSLRLFQCDYLEKPVQAGDSRELRPGETAVGELAAALAKLPLRSLCLDGDWEQDFAPHPLELASGLAGHPTLQRLWLRDLPSEKAGQSKNVQLVETLLSNAPALEALVMSGVTAFDGADGFHSTLLGALARGGTPQLRQLCLKAQCLQALTAAEVRIAAPALRSLELLRCRDADSSWVFETDLLETS